MAAIHGPIMAAHSSLFRTSHPMLFRSTSAAIKQAHPCRPFYGHKSTAKLCARFVTHLFACPDYPLPSTTTSPSTPLPPLATFIAYALHHARLHSTIILMGLYLLQCLEARFPAARGSSGHRHFISAFMIASKVMCDETYSNKSWCIVGQGMFAFREITQMEWELCSYLEWELNVEPSLLEFEAKVKKDFVGPGPYPTYTVPTPLSSQPTKPVVPDVNSPPLPPFIHQPTGNPASPKPLSNPLPLLHIPVPTPYSKPYPTTPPLMPDTPSLTYSDSSLMSSSPPTPPDGGDIIIDCKLQLVSDASDQICTADIVKALPKSKIGREVFTFATPAV